MPGRFPQGSWGFAVLNLDRGLELVMASVIVLLVVFVRSYEMAIARTGKPTSTECSLEGPQRPVGPFLAHRGRKDLSLASYFFFAFIALMFVVFAWSLRNPNRRTVSPPSAISQDPHGSHVTHLLQIRRALGPAAYQFRVKKDAERSVAANAARTPQGRPCLSFRVARGI
jgi:hypothetical protein